AVIRGAGHQRAQRTLQPRGHDALGPAALARRFAERPLKRVAKPAVRLEARAQGHVVQVRTVANLPNGFPQPPRPRRSLKSHAVTPEKVTSRPRGVDTARK